MDMIEVIKTMLPATMGDVLSANGVYGVGIASTSFAYALNSLMPKRMKSAAEIWCDVVGENWEPMSEEQEEELASIVDVFLQIARKGAAKANLRLLARIIAGQKATGELKSDEFMSYASVLEALSYEEVRCLAVLYKCWKNGGDMDQKMPLKEKIRKELIPCCVPAAEELDAIYEGLSRTGLLVRLNNLYDFSSFKPSKRFIDLMSLISPSDLFD